MKFFILMSFFIMSVNIFAQGGNTANDSGTTTASVIASLNMTAVEDLEFGEGIQGDAAVTITPVNGDKFGVGATGASFSLTGEPGRNYSVTLPADGTVTMTTGAGGANETIAVDSFTDLGESSCGGAIFQICVKDGRAVGGVDSFAVGATRAALGAAQAPGSYSGTFTVSVIYD